MYDFVEDNMDAEDPAVEPETLELGGEIGDVTVIYEPVRPSGEPELIGTDAPEALYRAAGAGGTAGAEHAPVRHAVALCPCCNRPAKRAIRVRDARGRGWSAVCAMCAAALLAEFPDSVVAGAVRPLRRRRRRLRDAG